MTYFFNSFLSSFCNAAIFCFMSWFSFLGKSFTFFKSKDKTIDDIPKKIKDNAVNVTIDIPENKGLEINKNDKIIPRILVMARLPQFITPASFRSKEIPSK